MVIVVGLARFGRGARAGSRASAPAFEPPTAAACAGFGPPVGLLGWALLGWGLLGWALLGPSVLRLARPGARGRLRLCDE